MTSHEIAIIDRPKMDAPGLVADICSCGQYQSAPGSIHSATKDWTAHAEAKRSADALQDLGDDPAGQPEGDRLDPGSGDTERGQDEQHGASDQED